MYLVIDEKEKQQIEEVFTLTGGELADKPLRYAWIAKDAKTWAYNREKGVGFWVDEPTYEIRRSWARYYYDGVPEYVEREFSRKGGDYITIVEDESFCPMPRKIRARGREWVKVARYGSSGETECPAKQADEEGDDHEWAHKLIGDDGLCKLCEEPPGSHSFIYIGDGWGEVVYKAKGS